MLKNLWEISGTGELRVAKHLLPDRIPWYSDVQKLSPLASSDHDQHTFGGATNPLWDIIRWMPAVDGDCWCTRHPKIGRSWIELRTDAYQRYVESGVERFAVCTEYAFSIISPGDVAWISQLVRGRPVVELGAGRGYWAWQLQQAGVTVHAYEPCRPGDDNTYFTFGEQFTNVVKRDHTAVDDHPDAALLMVWPGYGAPWAADALKRYRGDMVIYAGEGEGGCTADDEFYEVLKRDWEWLATSDKHVTWWGIHDHLQAYVRKQSPRVSLVKEPATVAG